MSKEIIKKISTIVKTNNKYLSKDELYSYYLSEYDKDDYLKALKELENSIVYDNGIIIWAAVDNDKLKETLKSSKLL